MQLNEVVVFHLGERIMYALEVVDPLGVAWFQRLYGQIAISSQISHPVY